MVVRESFLESTDVKVFAAVGIGVLVEPVLM